MSTRITARIDGGHVIVHELYLTGTIVSAIACEGDFESADGLKLYLGTELLGASKQCWRCLGLVAQKPSMTLGTIDVTLADKTKGKVQSWRHDVVVSRLAEDVPNFGHKLWQGQLSSRPELDAHIAHTHG